MATSERLVEGAELVAVELRSSALSFDEDMAFHQAASLRQAAEWVEQAAAALSAAEAKAERYRVALRGLMPYRAHLRTCEVGDTEFCTCGLRQAADTARAALTEGERDG